MEYNDSIKIKRMTSISDAPKTMSIRALLDSMETNYNFSKLILYSLNTLKSFLVTENPNILYENSIMILNSNINMFIPIR